MGKSKDVMGTVTSATIRRMENTYERLKCLKYETAISKPIHQDEFILPASNPAFQFKLYIEVVQWLISILNTNDKHKKKDDSDSDSVALLDVDVDEYEDPNLIAQKLMLSLRSLKFEMDFPIVKLKQPHGEIACSILDFLSKRAMSGFTLGDLEYCNENSKDDDEEDDGVVDDIIDDTLLCTGDYEDEDNLLEMSYFDDDDANSTQVPISRSDTTQNVIKPKVDTIEWKKELERVGPLLEVDIRKNTYDSWRNQLDSVFADSAQFERDFQVSKNAFERLCKETASAVDQMDSGERAIHEKFRKVGDEHEQVSRKLKDLEEKRNISKLDLDRARADLLTVTKRLGEVKARVEEKGNSITDTKKLVRIKTTLQDIKTEIRAFDLEIGMLEHTLLHKSLQIRAQ